MRKRQQRRPQRPDMRRIALQRTLAYLTVICPGVPPPIAFLEHLVSGDLMVEEGRGAVVQILAAAPAHISVGLDQLYRLTIQEPGRATITVTEAQREPLRQVARDLGADDSWVAAHGLGAPEMGCAWELHIAATLNADDFAPDQRALLAAHGLCWLGRALAAPGADGAYGAVQLFDALWHLADQEALAHAVLTPLAPRVIAHCAQYSAAWSDTSPCYYLASVGEALIEAGDPELRPWAARAFAQLAQLAADSSDEDQQAIRELLDQARQRCGLFA